MKLIFVTGLRELDRKTIVELALQRSGRKKEFTVVDFDKISEVAEEVEQAAESETARQMLTKFYEDMEKTVIADLKEQKGSMLINGYLTFDTRHGYIGAVPEGFFRSFKPDTIVILERQADLNERLEQRALEQQGINRYFGSIYASLTGSTLKIIRFRERKMMEAVEELGDVLRH